MALTIAGAFTTGILSISYLTSRSIIGGCKKFDLQPNFSVTDYMGRWYEF
jgi:hypothetical protein